MLENDTYLALNGFMSLEDSKKRDIPIYWFWDLETGDSQKEIDDNDIIDSEFIGKTMSMQIAVTGTQVMSNPFTDVVASTTINGKITNYNSIQDAIDAAGVNQGAIITLLGDNIQESVEIGTNQNLVFNTNRKNITSSGTTRTNRGTIKLVGEGIITGCSEEISDTIISTIINYGNLESCILSINSINGAGISNESSGFLQINGTSITSKNVGIRNKGTAIENPAVKIINVTIEAQTNAISNSSGAGTIVIDNGIFNGGNIGNTPTIMNNGQKIVINDGIVTALRQYAVCNWNGKEIIINGGNISGASSGVVCNIGKISITGGTIKGNYAIHVQNSSGIVELGKENDSNVANKTTPIIIGASVGTVNNGTIYFYDGIIKVQASNYYNSGNELNTLNGYHVYVDEINTEMINGLKYKTMYLEKD